MYQALWRTLIVTLNSQHPGSRSFYFHFINTIVCFGMNKMEFSFRWNKSVNFDLKTVRESSCGGGVLSL